MTKKAVVLVSGGLDSATVLAIAKKTGFVCYALTFDYGQRHCTELVAAAQVARTQGAVEHRVMKLDLSWIGGSALTDHTLPVPEAQDVQVPRAQGSARAADAQDVQVPRAQGAALDLASGIPITYVPARNTIFLAVALGWAEALGASDIFIGANAVDYSGYPDCRPAFIEAFETLANLATRQGLEGERFRVHAPLIALSKAEIIRTGLSLGVDYADTLSCYNPDEAGRPCRRCDACRLREHGFSSAGLADPALK